MAKHSNILPIQFEVGGLALFKVDCFPSPSIRTTADGIEFPHNGWRYWLPFDAKTIEGDPPLEVIPAESILSVAILWIQCKLERWLNLNGQTTQNGESIDFVANPEVAARIPLRHDRFTLALVQLQKGRVGLSVGVNGTSSGEMLLRQVGAFSKFAAGNVFGNACGTNFRIADDTSILSYDFYTLPAPRLVFSVNGQKTSLSKAEGLAAFGPYSTEKFRERDLHLLVLTRPSQRGKLESILQELRDGTAHHGQMSIWGKSWAQAYGLKGVKYHVVPLLDHRPETVETAIMDAQEARRKQDEKIDVAIFECEASLDPHPGPDAYTLLKGHLLAHGLPSQAITNTAMALRHIDRERALSNLALGIYAKAGGIPWLIPLRGALAHELVIGVGQTNLEGGILGFATIFSAHGHYRLGNWDFQSQILNWEGQLGNLVTEQIEELGKREGWVRNDTLRLLFHLGHAIPEEVAQNIRANLENRFKSRYDLHLGFLALESVHSFRIWDTGRPGIGTGRIPLGQYVPKRGDFYRINEDTALLQLALPDAHNPFPAPLLIRRLPESDEWGFDHLLDQVFEFAHLSWASTYTDPLPATLAYGNAITSLVQKLKAAGLLERTRIGLNSLRDIPWYL